MGQSYTYRCSYCGYESQFNEGHGFLIHSQPLNDYMKRGEKLFHYKTHRLLKKLSANGNDLFVKAGFQVYKCPRCKVLYDKTEVAVFDAGNIVHKSDFRCSKCKSRLKLTNIHRLKNANCPVCKHATFKMLSSPQQLWH